MKKAIFITDELFLNPNSEYNGGVKLCTQEYLLLVKQLFDCKIIVIKNKISFLSKVKIKLKIDTYKHYDNTDLTEVENYTETEQIEWVFLNMSNLIGVASKLKLKFPQIKTVLLSHGNESGDYLQEVSRFNYKNSINPLQAYKLGKLLIKESSSRLSDIDIVCTVSPIELQIEKWLNASEVIYIPRIVTPKFIGINPIPYKIGFIGDLSHLPNLDALEKLCNAMTSNAMENYQLCIIGKPVAIGKEFSKKFKFVTYLGYLNNEQVEKEIGSWAAFLNLLFYNSRGVSTKLGFALSKGLPIISTEIGLRGYEFKTNATLKASDDINVLCAIIKEYCSNDEKNIELVNISREVALNGYSIQEIALNVKQHFS